MYLTRLLKQPIKLSLLLKRWSVLDNIKTSVDVKFYFKSETFEATRAIFAGEIGRLIVIWKKWSIMIQGMEGLLH